MTDLHTHCASELSSAIAAKKLSAAEVMAATLARIDAINPEVNAIVALRDRDDLMAEAVRADAAPCAGWLHGIPIAIKDLTDVAGIPTSMGSPVFAGTMPATDDLMVARLRRAGAIIVGKTNTPEFGLGSHTYNPVYGATCNAYDARLSAGGSSGGAAVALATGMLSVADGSDMMGSLRNPAGWNNVYGFRPTWGTIPDTPQGEMYHSDLATKGPMARSVTDIARLLETMGGPDRATPFGRAARDLTDLQTSIKARRIGWLGDWGGGLPMQSWIIDHAEQAMQVWRDLGCEVDAVAPPFSMDALWDAWITLRSWHVGAGLMPVYEDPKKRTDLKPAAIWEIERFRAMTALDIHRASEIRSQWFRAAAEMFDTYDAVILPSAQVWPFPVGWQWPQEVAGCQMDTYHRWMQVVIPASLIGLPVLNVPAGFNEGCVPFGLQVVGRFGADRAVLELGEAWHTATGWPQRRPARV